jgi:4-carboxymuconolactone decarboxylase
MKVETSNPIYDAVPQLGRLRVDTLFGDVWELPELNNRDRSLITCAVLAATGKTEELAFHFPFAVKNGVTVDELRGLVTHVALYAGWPAGAGAAKAGLAIFSGDAESTE